MLPNCEVLGYAKCNAIVHFGAQYKAPFEGTKKHGDCTANNV